MTIQQLKYISAVEQDGSISKAAQKLYVSQPGVSAVIHALAGPTGHLFGKAFDEEKQQALSKACGICVLFLGIAGDARFVDAFVTASLTVCIGAMAIVGALRDGVSGDHSMLAVKAVLDFVVIAVLCSSLGKDGKYMPCRSKIHQNSLTGGGVPDAPRMRKTRTPGKSADAKCCEFAWGLCMISVLRARAVEDAGPYCVVTTKTLAVILRLSAHTGRRILSVRYGIV